MIATSTFFFSCSRARGVATDTNSILTTGLNGERRVAAGPYDICMEPTYIAYQ